MNIFLIGFMGSGKTTTGRKLASRKGLPFVDLDQKIEEKFNLSVQEIFELHGENAFREEESRQLRTYKKGSAIISLGGGTPCSEENIKFIIENGISVYLKMDAAYLTNRLENAKIKRPLLKKYYGNPDSMTLFIEDLLEQREYYYNQADIIFQAENMSAERIDLLIRLINQQSHNQ